MLRDATWTSSVKPVSFLARATRQGRNYTVLVGWLLYATCKGNASKLAIAVALSLAHLASQGAAIYAIYWYGRQMERTGRVTVPLLKITVNFKDQPEWLWAVVILSTVCFVMSAVFLYLARRQILDVIEKLYARKVEELVLLSFRLPDPRVRLASDLFMEYGLGGLSMGCRRGALTANSFSTAIMAAVGGIGAAIFLFWIDYSLTLLILIGVGLAALLLYPLTLRAVQSAKAREKAQAAFRVEVRELAGKRSVEQTVASIETADELARAYMMRRRNLTELIFAIEIGITVILGLVVYYMASKALAGREQWAIFLAYIASLRMALNGAAQPIRAFAGVSRYYPQIVRYYLFAKDMRRIDAVPLAQGQRGDSLILGTLPNGEDVVVEVGDCLALATFEPIRQLQYALLHARLRHTTAPLATSFIDPTTGVAGDAAIAIVSSNQLEAREEKELQALRDTLKDKVTLIVYQQADKVGAFGERYVLTLVEGELQRFASLGSEEGDAALKEFSLKAAARRRMGKGLFDDDDDDDDDDDG